jgi:bis(5'-nucleosyl)-tetraphosphatase (symmetrical)
MATYVVGDVQGCLDSLVVLLERIDFTAADKLWLVGDVVNRGPRSLDSLRFVKDLGAQATMVLGNHDLHLLAVAHGVGKVKRLDTIAEILAAPDRTQLLTWLSRQPLMHRADGWTMIHAGLIPEWTVEEACTYADELSSVLHGPRAEKFYRRMYGNEPARWSDSLAGFERLRFITNVFTRTRYLTADGALTLREKGPPGTEAADLIPWYAFAQRASVDERIVFGHWASLQALNALDPVHNVYHVDNGCAWGRELTALRLDDQQYFSVAALETPVAPG